MKPLGYIVLFCFLSFSASAQNRVLELDGNGSYQELPPNILKDLDEASHRQWSAENSSTPRWYVMDRNDPRDRCLRWFQVD
jgi:hypothetical protein